MNNLNHLQDLISETLNTMKDRNYSPWVIENHIWAFSVLQKFCKKEMITH